MEKRSAVPGDILVTVVSNKRVILVPQTGDKIEVIVPNGTVTKIEYLGRWWKWYIIPITVKVTDFATFFYRDLNCSPDIWLTSNGKLFPFRNISSKTRFIITKYVRNFDHANQSLFGTFWRKVTEASEQKELENSQ